MDRLRETVGDGKKRVWCGCGNGSGILKVNDRSGKEPLNHLPHRLISLLDYLPP